MKRFFDFLNEKEGLYETGPSSIHGIGVFSIKRIPKGTFIGITHYGYPDDVKTTELGKCHNHSEDPNVVSRLEGIVRKFFALRDIEPKEEITVDYRRQPELEQPKKSWKKGIRSLGLQ